MREVTGEDNYETWQMALVDYKMPADDLAAITKFVAEQQEQEQTEQQLQE